MINNARSIQIDRRDSKFMATFFTTIVSIILIGLAFRFIIPNDISPLVAIISVFGAIAICIVIIYFTCTAKLTITMDKEFIRYHLKPASTFNYFKIREIVFTWHDVKAWELNSVDTKYHTIDIISLAVDQHGLVEIEMRDYEISGNPEQEKDALALLYDWLPERPRNIQDFNLNADQGLFMIIMTITGSLIIIGSAIAFISYAIYSVFSNIWSALF